MSLNQPVSDPRTINGSEKVEGEALDTTHYRAEESPEDIAERMSDFFFRNPIHMKETAK